jgi:hypothetical protein
MTNRKKRSVFNDAECINDLDTPFCVLEQRRYIGGSSKAKTSTTQSSVVQNQQVGASEGAIAAGAGATINLEQVSDDIVYASLGEIGNVSNAAISMAGDTAKVGADTVKFSLGESLGFARDFTTSQITSAREERKDTLDFLNRQTETIAAQAGVVSPASVTDQQKLLMIGLAVLAGAAVIIVMVQKKG